MITALHIKTDGSAELFEFDPGDAKALEVLQERVGGWIEAVVADDPSITMYANEEGRILGLPPNLGVPGLVGDVVIVGAPDEEGNDTTLPEVYLDALRQVR